MVLGSLADALGVDRGRLNDDAYATHVGVQAASLLAWHRAPLVAVFDDELAAALLATPMNGDIPQAVLARLPSWSIYIPLPWLRRHGGVFVSYDTGNMSQPGQPDMHMQSHLLMQFTVSGHDPLIALFRCSDRTIRASMDSHIREWAAPDAGEDVFSSNESDRRARELLGQPYLCAVEQTISLVLYLCSDEPDLMQVKSALTSVMARHSASVAAPKLVEVGYRVGAALRAHARTDKRVDGEAGRPRPKPHVRTAHWHTYWYGPRTDPSRRTARVRWISPILVNARHDVPVPTARPVSQ